MYARRQRRVQSGSTNVQTLVLTTLNPDEILSANLKSYDILHGRVSALHGCQGGGAATRLTADQLHSGSNPDLGLRRCASAHRRGEERVSVLRTSVTCVRPPFRTRKHLKATCGDCGHSCRETPGLIPNPAVKLTHVVCCTEVRESPGSIPSCNHLPSYTVFW